MFDKLERAKMDRNPITDAYFYPKVHTDELAAIEKTIAQLEARAESDERDLMLRVLRQRRSLIEDLVFATKRP